MYHLSPFRSHVHSFGRIGRLVLRAALAKPEVDVVGVNDPFLDVQYMVCKRLKLGVIGSWLERGIASRIIRRTCFDTTRLTASTRARFRRKREN